MSIITIYYPLGKLTTL